MCLLLQVRLFALYGMGGAAVSLANWWNRRPEWLEVRPLDLPGHGWRSAEPMPFAPGAPSDPLRFVPPLSCTRSSRRASSR